MEAAIARVSKRRYSNFDGRKRYYALFENLKAILPSKLVVAVNNKSEYIDLNDVLYFEQSQNGSVVVKDDGVALSIDNKLKDMEDVLDAKNFARINSKQLVNLTMIKHIGRDGFLDLKKGNSLNISCEYLNEVVGQLETFVNQK